MTQREWPVIPDRHRHPLLRSQTYRESKSFIQQQVACKLSILYVGGVIWKSCPPHVRLPVPLLPARHVAANRREPCKNLTLLPHTEKTPYKEQHDYKPQSGNRCSKYKVNFSF